MGDEIKINKNTLFAVIAIIIMVGGVIAMGLGGMSAGSSMGAATLTTSGDIFDGTITNVAVSPGIVNGTGVYDRSCVSVGNGLTNCDAGISTAEYGVLNFNYSHNMQAKHCIDEGQVLVVEILDSEGNARVSRTASAMRH